MTTTARNIEALKPLLTLSYVGRELGRAGYTLAALKITSREQAEAFVADVAAACAAHADIGKDFAAPAIFESTVRAVAALRI
jgi:hypothetical protein